MRHPLPFLALLVLISIPACSDSATLAGPEAGPTSRVTLQDGTDPSSNNHHAVVRLSDGTDPSSNNRLGRTRLSDGTDPSSNNRLGRNRLSDGTDPSSNNRLAGGGR